MGDSDDVLERFERAGGHAWGDELEAKAEEISAVRVGKEGGRAFMKPRVCDVKSHIFRAPSRCRNVRDPEAEVVHAFARRFEHFCRNPIAVGGLHEFQGHRSHLRDGNDRTHGLLDAATVGRALEDDAGPVVQAEQIGEPAHRSIDVVDCHTDMVQCEFTERASSGKLR